MGNLDQHNGRSHRRRRPWAATSPATATTRSHERGSLARSTAINGNPTLGGARRYRGGQLRRHGILHRGHHGPGSRHELPPSWPSPLQQRGHAPYSSVSTFTTAGRRPNGEQPDQHIGASPTTATLGGTVTSDGGAAITSRGCSMPHRDQRQPDPGRQRCDPRIDDPANTTGTFTANITGLSPGTSYSFVIFATNSEGTTATPAPSPLSPHWPLSRR